MARHAERSAPDGGDRRTLLAVKGHVAARPRIHYINHPFHVPEGASKVGVAFSFHKRIDAPIYIHISLHDVTGFRGVAMDPWARGPLVQVELWVAPDRASNGGLLGPLPAGEWRVQLDVEFQGDEADYQVEAYAEFGTPQSASVVTYPPSNTIRQEADWYKGELHAHSTESDGFCSVEENVRLAVEAGLDFLSLSDHYTVSQWTRASGLTNDRPIILRSCELNGHYGHANLQGISDWVDVYVDRPGWSMQEAAGAVHRQRGLFCVNHPFSDSCGWRVYDFDWSSADLMEVYSNLGGPDNNLTGPLWDHHLRMGRRLVGVAGTDSHDPRTERERLGKLVTWVYGSELSEWGIIEGLRSGRVYVSRGPELRFRAISSIGESAEMWECLPLSDMPVTFHVGCKTSEPLRVFLLRDGYPFELKSIDAMADQWQSLTFSDKPTRPAYYRLEMHTPHISEDSPWAKWRDYSTLRAMSNPMWVGKPSARGWPE